MWFQDMVANRPQSMPAGPPLGRRDFCKNALAVGGTLALGGCAATDPESGAVSESSSTGNEQFRAELGLPEPKTGLESEVNILQWTRYWHPNTVRDFEDAYSVTVNDRYYASNEELYEILRNEGLDSWDLVVPSDWMITRMIDEEMLQPIDTDRLENWDNLADRWINDAPYDRGEQRYSVPYMWATTGLAWHKEMVDGRLNELDHLDSWDAMWSEAYASQIQMLSLPRELYAAALKRLGYSLNTTDQDEIAEATELLAQQKALVSDYVATGLIDDLLNRRATPMQTYSGDGLAARQRLSDGDNSPITYRIPEEGGVRWVDGAAMPAEASNPNAALTFVDYILNSTISARNANFTFYASPNEEARSEIVPELVDDEAVYPPERVLENLEFIEDVGDAEVHYQNGWETVRNA